MGLGSHDPPETRSEAYCEAGRDRNIEPIEQEQGHEHELMKGNK
jgi:hypothetical protein